MHDTATLETRERTVRGQAVATDEAMVVRFRPAVRWTDEELFRFCQQNGSLRIEQTARGEIIIMPPVGLEGSQRNFDLHGPFMARSGQVGGFRFCDATGGFRLPDGSMLSPDLAWVRQERLDALTSRQRKKFPPLCPDFVVELRSESDRLPTLQRKMDAYMANGARLGWLIDPLEKQVFVYRPGEKPERLKDPVTLSGEPVLAGFTLDLARVW